MFKGEVITVPSSALHFTPNAEVAVGYTIVDCPAEQKVWTLTDKTFTAIPVAVGLTDGINTEIISGLTEGQEVVTDMNFTELSAQKMGTSQERSPFMPQHPGSKKK